MTGAVVVVYCIDAYAVLAGVKLAIVDICFAILSSEPRGADTAISTRHLVGEVGIEAHVVHCVEGLV